MEKRKACTILALCASFVFSLIYFVIFGALEVPEKTEVVVVNDENVVYQEHNYLSWIQLGVFKEKNSYEALVTKCQSLNLEPMTISFGDKVAVVAGCRESRFETEALLTVIQDNQLEYILKDAEFTAEEAQQLIAKKKYQEVLEGYVYQ